MHSNLFHQRKQEVGKTVDHYAQDLQRLFYEFIRRVWKTRVMDIKRLQVNDSSYIEDTICLVNE